MRIGRVITCTLVLLVLQFVPFIVIGETWGMVWYLINLPLSDIAENNFGISGDTPFLIFTIGAANSFFIALIIEMVIYATKKGGGKGVRAAENVSDTNNRE